MKRFRCSSLFCLLFALTVACGDDDGSTTDAGSDGGADAGAEGSVGDGGPDGSTYDPITLEELCTAWREAAERAVCTDLSEQECLELIGGQGGEQRCASAAESIASGRSTFDGAEAARCIAETSDQDLSSGWDNGFLPGCTPFAGAVATGGDCYPEASINTDECADGYCEWDFDTCPGTCKAFQARGATCNTELRCGTEDFCKRDCEPPCDGTCEVRPGEGEACEFNCQSGLFCPFENPVCIRVRGEGEACSINEECAQGFCRNEICQQVAAAKGDACLGNRNCPDPLICDFEDKTCQDRTPVGEACPSGNDVCAEDALCAPAVGTEESTCVTSLGEDGDPCTYLCEDDHFCNTEGEDEVCRADRGMGEDCSGNTAISGAINLACQDGLHCMESSTGTCLPPGKLDEPCFYNRTETCEPGLWCTIIESKCIEPASGEELCYSLWPDACANTDYCGVEGGTRGGWGSDTCLPKQALEEPCLEDSVCESGICVWANEDDELGACASERPVEQNRCIPS